MLLVNLDYLSLLADWGPGVALVSRFLGAEPLKTLNGLPDGRCDLAPGIWVNLESPQGRDAGTYESHRLHADLQISLTGGESVACMPLERLQLKEDYDPKRDIAFWTGPSASSIPLLPGTGLWLFPRDGHMPCLGRGELHKAVFKVHRDLFGLQAQKVLFK